jgi:hypothetical protein
MDPHDFGLLDPHPKSAFQMQIRIQLHKKSVPKFKLLIRSSLLWDKRLKIFKKHLLLFKKSVYFEGTVQRELISVFTGTIYG